MSQPEEPASAPPATELEPDNQQPPVQSDSSNPAEASRQNSSSN